MALILLPKPFASHRDRYQCTEVVGFSRAIQCGVVCGTLLMKLTDLWTIVWLEISFRLSLQELYRKIESQARVVGACIRSAEKEINERQKQQQSQGGGAGGEAAADEQNLNSIESTSSSQLLLQKRSAPTSAGTTSNLKGLEKRYHLLYLKAFEIQCMLESLLHKKEDQVSDLYRANEWSEDRPRQRIWKMMSPIVGMAFPNEWPELRDGNWDCVPGDVVV